ncbi:DEAD/DEAH box helicase [Bacteroidota bacterium]
MSLQLFHMVVQDWFRESLGKPTKVQTESWEAIREGQHTLISAPTGSGKTLAAFLVAIDDLLKKGLAGKLEQKTQVLYISPLKALSNDIERNLQIPLKGIKYQLKKQNHTAVTIDVAVRTGDTSQYERTSMYKMPPHIIVTTPESFYLLLTSNNGRKLLSTIDTVIVDEIHAIVGSKRGSHLALSLERLENIVAEKVKRIGISATQKPIEEVARFLIGSHSQKDIHSHCKIVNTGHRRKLDIDLVLPDSPLTPIMANEVWSEIYSKLIKLVHKHDTTLIFVSTRRLAERLSFNLTEQLGKEAVTAHHGSMSKEHRLEAEQKLKSGKLKALVATASLELGIDIGSVDLVCHISSSRSISTILQRIGRSGHSVHGTPKGRIFPLTRNDLLECTAILYAIRKNELDTLIMPQKPIDVLAQQIVAEVSAEEYSENELFETFQRAYPYRNLGRDEYNEVVEMLSEGFTTRKGRRSAYLHHDMVNEKLKARKNARLTALVAGGTIPDNFDFDVILDPEGSFIGSVNEDFAIESLPGDIFQLGNKSWKINKIENGRVRVEDADGLPPTIPFWFGEAPGRSKELCEAVSLLIKNISDKLGNLKEESEYLAQRLEIRNDQWKYQAVEWLKSYTGIGGEAAVQLATYIALSRISLGSLPGIDNLIIERFFDDAGDMHMVIHSLFGSRFNRAWGLALRKRFCRKFNFELQAAADENTIILSLGSTHSFPLQEVFSYLNPKTVREILIQALLEAPMFEVRWRWNASTALAVVRRRAGKRVPAQIQRMQSEDLIALIFPDQLACLENIAGDREIPGHPLINQTLHDCLYEVMDIEKLEKVLDLIQKNKINLVSRDLTEPSPMAQEILVAQPYAFLDNAPAEERRVNAIQSRRWAEIEDVRDLGKLDAKAIKKVKEEAWPQARNGDELHDALVMSGFFTDAEMNKESNTTAWPQYFDELVSENRATYLYIKDSNIKLCIAVERLPEFMKVYSSRLLNLKMQIPERIKILSEKIENPLLEIIRSRLEILGPVNSNEISSSMDLKTNEIEQVLLGLENEGFIFRGKFTTGKSKEEWCERRLLARIHRYTIDSLRKSIEPVPQSDFMQFLFKWQHVYPEDRLEGKEALQNILGQLEGYEAQSVAWEADILPARIKGYDYIWLDLFFMTGNFFWGRFNSQKNEPNKNGSPIRTTPVSFVQRKSLEKVLKYIHESGTEEKQLSTKAAIVREILENNGALFFSQISDKAKGLVSVQVEEALSELVSYGLVSSDSFTGLRSLLVPDKYQSERRRSRKTTFGLHQAGRWWLVDSEIKGSEENGYDEYVQHMAKILLNRYGVVFRKLVEKEKLLFIWRDLIRIYRKMEAHGEIRGGRFVQGFWGEQFALPEAVTMLRKANKEKNNDQLIAISAADPLNLTGFITSGKRIPAIYSNRILYKNGIPIVVKEGKEIKFLRDVSEKNKWELQKFLIRRDIQPELRPYLLY